MLACKAQIFGFLLPRQKRGQQKIRSTHIRLPSVKGSAALDSVTTQEKNAEEKNKIEAHIDKTKSHSVTRTQEQQRT